MAAQTIFRRLRLIPGAGSLEEQQGNTEARIASYADDLARLFRQAGIDAVEAMRKEICRDEMLLDQNRDLHNLIRLTLPQTELRLRGNIGLAMCFRVMAEMIRRVAESTFACELPEEDECGLGWSEAIKNTKVTLFGNGRILDNDSATRAFLKQQGLDLGLKVRWYVEGYTESEFLDYTLEALGVSGIEIINLRGQVAQAKKNILGFRDSLRNDMRLEIFSLVTVDADLGEVRQAVRAAITQDEFFGRVFMPPSGQDFEFANFTLDELAEVLWQSAAEQGAEEAVRDQIYAAVQGAKSADELISRANAAQSKYRFKKGLSWGRALAVYASSRPTWPDGRRRPVGEAIEYALRIQNNQYAWTRNKYRVDPASGEMVPRTTNV